jgi:hypothetical protein
MPIKPRLGRNLELDNAVDDDVYDVRHLVACNHALQRLADQFVFPALSFMAATSADSRASTRMRSTNAIHPRAATTASEGPVRADARQRLQAAAGPQ